MPDIDHDILVRIAQDVADIKKEIEGNGRPGLRDRVTAVETLMQERDRTALKAGSLGAAGTIILGALLEWFRQKGV